MTNFGELNQKYTKMATIYKEIMLKIDNLQEIEVKLDEVKKKKEDAEQKITELDKQINEIKARSQTADTPKKKAQEDDLLAQAMAAKQEAENDLNTAKENEQKLLDTAKQKTDEIKSINDQISALKQGNK